MPHLQHLKIQHVTVYIIQSVAGSIDVPPLTLRFTEEGGIEASGGDAGAVEGAFSTRHGSWTALQGKNPAGEWELAFANTSEMQQRFIDGKIENILLVITYAGRLPEWPAE